LGSRCTCSAVLVFGELAGALRTVPGLTAELNGIKVQELESNSGAVLVTIPVEVEGGILECEEECKKRSEAISMAILLGTRAAGLSTSGPPLPLGRMLWGFATALETCCGAP